MLKTFIMLFPIRSQINWCLNSSPVLKIWTSISSERYFKKSAWLTEFIAFSPTFCGLPHPHLPIPSVSLGLDHFVAIHIKHKGNGMGNEALFRFAVFLFMLLLHPYGFFSPRGSSPWQTLPLARPWEMGRYQTREAQPCLLGVCIHVTFIPWKAFRCPGTRGACVDKWLCWRRWLSVQSSSFRAGSNQLTLAASTLTELFSAGINCLTNYDRRSRGSSSGLKIRWLNPTGSCVRSGVWHRTCLKRLGLGSWSWAPGFFSLSGSIWNLQTVVWEK